MNLAFLFLLICPGSMGALVGLCLHPDSESLTEIWVRADHLTVHFEVQLESLAEVLPAIDGDADGTLTEAELLACTPGVLEYLGQHLRLVRGSHLGGNEPMDLASPTLRLLNGGQPLERDRRVWLGVAYRLPLESPVRQFSVALDPFLDTSPGHLSTLIVHWPDALPDLAILSAGETQWSGQRGPSLRLDALISGGQVGLLGAAPLVILLLAAASLRARWVLAVWLLGVGVGVAVLTPAGVALELRTLGLACAVGAVYLGSDVALNPEARNRWLAAGLLGATFGLLLAQHPSLLSPVLAPASTRGIFFVAGPACAVLTGLVLVPWARDKLVSWGWACGLIGLVVFGLRAWGLLAAGG